MKLCSLVGEKPSTSEATARLTEMQPPLGEVVRGCADVGAVTVPGNNNNKSPSLLRRAECKPPTPPKRH